MADGALKLRDKEETERRLVEAAQRDPRRFAELYEIHFERVYAFIARRVGDRDTAQDLTADVFHNALKNLKRFQWRGVPFGAWLFRIAANAVASHGKRSARAANSREKLAPPMDGTPELEEIEHRARLFKLVGALPVDQRRVINMRFGGNLKIAEIAVSLRRSEGAIKQLQLRALQNLRTMMGER